MYRLKQQTECIAKKIVLILKDTFQFNIWYIHPIPSFCNDRFMPLKQEVSMQSKVYNGDPDFWKHNRLDTEKGDMNIVAG